MLNVMTSTERANRTGAMIVIGTHSVERRVALVIRLLLILPLLLHKLPPRRLQRNHRRLQQLKHQWQRRAPHRAQRRRIQMSQRQLRLQLDHLWTPPQLDQLWTIVLVLLPT